MTEQRWRIPWWYVAILAPLAVQRLQELRISSTHERDRPGKRAAAGSYPLMVALHGALFALPLLEATALGVRRPRWPWLGVLAAAGALRVWSIRSLGSAWNVKAVVPDDLQPSERGPYRWIRHPNYLAVILEFAAAPLTGGATLSAFLLSALNAVVLFDRIRGEERLLDASPEYRRAFAGRARFIPGVF